MPRAQELSQSRHCFGAILPYLRRAVRRTDRESRQSRHYFGAIDSQPTRTEQGHHSN